MARKRMWKEWVVDYIIKTDQCPGDIPSFGLPTDMLTQEEFDRSIGPMQKHQHRDCHFVPEILGVAQATQDMKEIKINEGSYKDKLDTFQGDVAEVQRSKRLFKLKENLHLYIDRIHFKPNGTLSVPSPLLKINNYINKFFNE